MRSLVIADTSCLIVLDKINRLALLQEFYSEIYISPEIENEYGKNIPDWIKTIEVNDKQRQKILELELDKGEASAIALGLENENSLLLIDEKKGRKIALGLGLKITGTLGLLIKAKEDNLIDSLRIEIEKMKQEGFRMSEKLIEKILNKHEQ